MNCPLETRGNTELLVAYSSGGLGADRGVSLKEHLGDCAACREFVHNQATVWQALDLWNAPPVSDDFDRRLRQRVETEGSWWERVARSLGLLVIHRALPLAATTALLVVAGVLLERPTAHRPAPANLATAQGSGLEPAQVVQALDEMDALSKFNYSLKADGSESQM